MIIVRKSPVTGKMNQRNIDISFEQYDAWANGELIQDAMPNIKAEDREFIISGCTPDDFLFLFPEDCHDENR